MVSWRVWLRSPYAKAGMVLLPVSIFGGFGYRLYVQYLDLEQSYLDAVEHQVKREASGEGNFGDEGHGGGEQVIPKALTRQQRTALEKERDRIIGQLAKLEAVRHKRKLELEQHGGSGRT